MHMENAVILMFVVPLKKLTKIQVSHNTGDSNIETLKRTLGYLLV